MSAENVKTAFGFAVIVGLFAFGAVINWGIVRRIHRVPRSPTAAIVRGETEIAGVAEPLDRTTPLPMSGILVLHGSWSIEERRRVGKRTQWVAIRSGVVSRPFLVRDEHGTAVVDARGEEGEDLPILYEARSGFFRRAPEAVEAFLARKGWDKQMEFRIRQRLRYRERGILDGERVYVLGNAERAEDGRWRLRDAKKIPLYLAVGTERGRFLRHAARAIGWSAAAIVTAVVGISSLWPS